MQTLKNETYRQGLCRNSVDCHESTRQTISEYRSKDGGRVGEEKERGSRLILVWEWVDYPRGEERGGDEDKAPDNCRIISYVGRNDDMLCMFWMGLSRSDWQ